MNLKQAPTVQRALRSPSVEIDHQVAGPSGVSRSMHMAQSVEPAAPGVGVPDISPDNGVKHLENAHRHYTNLVLSHERSSEKEIINDIELEESMATKIKISGKRLLRCGFSEPGSGKTAGLNREPKLSAGSKILRNLMKFGWPRRSRAPEEYSLLDVASGDGGGGGGGYASPETLSDTTYTDDNHSPSRRSSIEYTDENYKKVLSNSGDAAAALKAADFQVCVSIHEVRQLLEANLYMDPVVCVEVGDMRKCTSVKENTNGSIYNVVYQARILRANKRLCSFKVDVATVWSEPDHLFHRKSIKLTNPGDVSGLIKGILNCSIIIIRKGDFDLGRLYSSSDRDEHDTEV